MKATYANQNIYQINREMPEKGTKQRPYITIFNDNLFAAMQDLNGESAVKLYLYLAANQNKFNLNFSPKHVALNCGISENSARAAAKQLMEKNYLIQDETNHYQFYEVPQKQRTLAKQIREEIRKVDFDDGTSVEMSFSAFYEECKKCGWADEVIKQNWLLQTIVEQ